MRSIHAIGPGVSESRHSPRAGRRAAPPTLGGRCSAASSSANGARATRRSSPTRHLRAAVRHEGPLDPTPGASYVIGVDLGLKRDRSAAAVCHAENEDVILSRLGVWQGSRRKPVRLGEVEDWLAEAAARFNGAEVVFDPWQSVGLMQRLQGRGLRCSEFSFSAQSVGRLAASLFNALRDGRLGLPNDADLLDELAHVQLRETSPGVFRLDHPPGRHDDRAIALALAAIICSRSRVTRKPSRSAPRTGAGASTSSGTASADRIRSRGSVAADLMRRPL